MRTIKFNHTVQIGEGPNSIATVHFDDEGIPHCTEDCRHYKYTWCKTDGTCYPAYMKLSIDDDAEIKELAK